MPRSTSTVMKPQTFAPDRCFQLSPAHVSLYFSPARGTEWNVHSRLPVCPFHARTSPAGPRGGFSCVLPPVMTRCLYTTGGELSPSLPGSPCRISGVSRSTIPLAPKASLGLPVFASSEYNLPSFEPKTICGGVCASPGQYSTPLVEGFPEGSRYAQSSSPVAESTAATRLYGVARYIVPFTTSGVTSLDARRADASAGFM